MDSKTPMTTTHISPPKVDEADLIEWLRYKGEIPKYYDACINCLGESRGNKFCSRKCEEEYR